MERKIYSWPKRNQRMNELLHVLNFITPDHLRPIVRLDGGVAYFWRARHFRKLLQYFVKQQYYLGNSRVIESGKYRYLK